MPNIAVSAAEPSLRRRLGWSEELLTFGIRIYFFAFSPISTFEDAAGASAVISNLSGEWNATVKMKPAAIA
jgi:hypothetical protein